MRYSRFSRSLPPSGALRRPSVKIASMKIAPLSLIAAFSFCAFVSFFYPSSIVRAQESEGSSPLELGRRVVPDVLGVLIGPGFYGQNGSFDTGCPCTFSGGVGAGIVLGAMYEKNLLSPGPVWRLGTINIGARLLYEERNINAVFREYEQVSVQSLAQPSQFFTVPILFRHLAEINFSLLTFTPYISWSPFAIGALQPFAQLGFQAGYTLNGRFRHTKFVLDEVVRLPNGEEAEVAFSENDSNSLVVEDADVKDLNRLQFAASFALGADLPIGSQFRLTAAAHYLLPLTAMSSAPDQNISLTTLQILIGLKMNLDR